jgi:hypothetical protein
VIPAHTSCRYVMIDISPTGVFADYRIFAVHGIGPDGDYLLASEAVATEHGVHFRAPRLLHITDAKVTLMCPNYKSANNMAKALRQQDREAEEANG